MSGQVLAVLHEALIIRLEFTGLPFRLVRALLAAAAASPPPRKIRRVRARVTLRIISALARYDLPRDAAKLPRFPDAR